MRRRIVITGAHSYLGRRTVRHLEAEGGYDLTALVTPWAADAALPGGVRVLRADLEQPLPPDVRDALAQADHVLHFAWIRGRDVEPVSRRNAAVLAGLLGEVREASRLSFVSSVAASPTAQSTYGRTKWEVARLARERGASVLVVGLVVEDVPQGPYRLLCRVAEKVPVAFRLSGSVPSVYPVRVEDFLACMARVAAGDGEAASTYRVFESPATDFNRFMEAVERRYPRARLRLAVDARLTLGAVGRLKAARLAPPGLADKALTFLYKDDRFLDTLASFPGCNFSGAATLVSGH